MSFVMQLVIMFLFVAIPTIIIISAVSFIIGLFIGDKDKWG